MGNKRGTIINGVWHNSSDTYFIGNTPPAKSAPENQARTGGNGRNLVQTIRERKIEPRYMDSRDSSTKQQQDDEPKEGGAAIVGVNGQGASIAALLVAVIFLVEMV